MNRDDSPHDLDDAAQTPAERAAATAYSTWVSVGVNLIMTIVVPLCLFIWFIIAFLWDGNSWLTLRNRYNGEPAKIEKTTPAAKEKGAKD